MEDDEAELISDPRHSGGKQQVRGGRSNSDHHHRAPNNQQFELGDDEEDVEP